MMLNLDLAAVLFLLSGTAAGIAVVYYSFVRAREWFGQRHYSGKGIFRKKNRPQTSLNAHIATEWTEGRLRLDSVLALIRSLADLLEKEVTALRRFDHSDPRYEKEVGQMVGPTLRCFTFDKHLRDECRVLIPLLRFCAKDLAHSQGLDMTQQLSILNEIQAALESADLH
jgi:hypothetical protein